MNEIGNVIHRFIVNHPCNIWQCCNDLINISAIFIQQFHELSLIIISFFFIKWHFYFSIGVVIYVVPLLMSKDSSYYFSNHQCRYGYHCDDDTSYYFSFKICSNNHISFTNNVQDDSEDLMKFLDEMHMLTASLAVNLQDYTHNMLNYYNCQDYHS